MEPRLYFCKNLTLIKIESPGFKKKYRNFDSGEGKHRSAIVVTNTQIDVVLIKQMSDLDTVVNAVPLQAWSGSDGSRKFRFPDFMTTAQKSGKVVSLTHRPHLPPGNSPGTHFC